MSAELAWQYIVEGKWIAAAISVYTSLIGSWFWLALFGALFISLWAKARDVAVPAIAGLLLSPLALALLPPEAHPAAVALLALSAGSLIVRAVRGAG